VKSLTCCCCAIGLLGTAFAFAASPTTNESSVGTKSDRPRLGRIDGQRPAGNWRDRSIATSRPSSEELREVDEFMNENSPKRWAKIKDMPDERRSRLNGFVVQRFRMLQDLKQNDQAMYDLRVKRLKIEDEIFSLGWDLKNNKNENFSPDAAKKDLRKKVRALADSRIDEHRLRLKQWQEKIEQEQKKLAEEKANIDQFVDSSVNAIENDMKWPGLGEMPFPGRSAPSGKELRNMAPASQPSESK
jgi:hypothetical protein